MCITKSIITLLMIYFQSCFLILDGSEIRPQIQPQIQLKLENLEEEEIKLGDFSQLIYRGEWTSKNSSILDYIPTQKGSILVYLNQDGETPNQIAFIFQIYENDFIENRNLIGKTNMTLTSKSQTVLTSNSDANITKVDKIFIVKESVVCKAISTISIFDNKDQPLNINSDLLPGMYLKGSIKSTDCKFEIDFKADFGRFLLPLSLFAMSIGMIMIFLGLKPLIKALLHNLHHIYNLSENALMGNIICDILIMLTNVILTLVSFSVYYVFSVVLSFFLMSSLFIKVDIYFRVYKLRNEQRQISSENAFRNLTKESMKMGSLIIFGLMISSYFILNYYLFCVLFSYPIFQVIFNYNKVVKKNCFDIKMYLPLFASQLWFPVYLRGYYSDLVKLDTDYLFVSILCGQVLFCIFVMYLQSVFGPKFFIPKKCRSSSYIYERKLKGEMQNEGVTCPICFFALMHQPNEEEKDLKGSMLLKKFMRTPCNHDFHEVCLKQWMDLKLNCPCCRKEIPPYD